ncbi:MAG: YajD family HNH nuclease [Gammaproteobacteria bacterium]
MPTRKVLDKTKLDQIVADAQRSKAEREKGYREQALKMYPWICGRCAREFDHANVRELTVHHRDHNHDNNPSDGSNWELLCLYCHDNEHARYENAHYNSNNGSAADNKKAGTHNPFANLDSLLKNKK